MTAMPATDEYATIAHPGHAETRILASRFLADALPVQSKESIEQFLQEIRKKSHDATHHCYAYRLGTDAPETRAADDGEPGGTAGKPILAAIEGKGLTNTLVVVTRYFGGTKLGTGGLVRAYGEAAALALKDAGQIKCVIAVPLAIAVDHPLVSKVMHTVSRCGARIAETRYDDQVHFCIEIRRSHYASLKRDLVQATSGGVRFEDSGENAAETL
jgi:uncharacterized YigZ family protein